MQRQREERERESNTTTTQLSLPAGGYQLQYVFKVINYEKVEVASTYGIRSGNSIRDSGAGEHTCGAREHCLDS
jgi:hypothetical protein